MSDSNTKVVLISGASGGVGAGVGTARRGLAAQARELLFLVREAMNVAGYKVLVYAALGYSCIRP
jgi:NADP-dependent 3-hydroxy acid dehydrogenase YdfG